VTHTTQGDVSRWHAKPSDKLRLSGDTITAHQIRCAEYLIQLYPAAPARLVHIVRVHDEAERIVGDMPYPAKLRFPALRAAYEAAEAEVMAEMGHPVPETPKERAWLKLVDRLDAQVWMLRHAPELARDDEWRDSGWVIHAMAEKLGVADAVQAIMEGA
jgi:hypothetical protein